MQIIYKIYQKDVTGITDALSLAEKNAQWELVTIFKNSTKPDALKYIEFCLGIEELKAKFDYDGRSLKFKIEEEYMESVPKSITDKLVEFIRKDLASNIHESTKAKCTHDGVNLKHIPCNLENFYIKANGTQPCK